MLCVNVCGLVYCLVPLIDCGLLSGGQLVALVWLSIVA